MKTKVIYIIGGLILLLLCSCGSFDSQFTYSKLETTGEKIMKHRKAGYNMSIGEDSSGVIWLFPSNPMKNGDLLINLNDKGLKLISLTSTYEKHKDGNPVNTNKYSAMYRKTNSKKFIPIGDDIEQILIWNRKTYPNKARAVAR